MSAPRHPFLQDRPEPVSVGLTRLTMILGAFALAVVIALSAWFKFGAGVSDYQRLYALEAQIADLQVLVAHYHLAEGEEPERTTPP
jgi:hypothetical protein